MKPLSKKLEMESSERHTGEKKRENEVDDVKSKISTKAGATKGPSQHSKGIKHGDAGRNLEDTEHHERMGHTTDEY